ncbi:MAG TPA: urease accessory protein UreF [Lentisphaeria bacterium]|nr:MAG: hypothetical protein A2X47_11880 [Lentisphaerae bacterium GWF2_38_69]HBM16677.1 urease accessory protein UreF [Lentisphaeria bacterium]
MDKQFFNSLLLLQINDSLFPMGAYSHSYGLETYVQKGIVKDKESAIEYIGNNINNSFLFNDLFAVKLAYEAVYINELEELDSIFYASKAPKEIRMACEKLGSRFIKNINSLSLHLNGIYKEYCILIANEKCKGLFPLLYGAFCAASGMDKQSLLISYSYSQVSGMINNCVKLIPLSQTDGQSILYGSYEFINNALRKLETLKLEDLGRSSPGFELRAIQHETLYSRLYMS